jgi:hypothetical protein
MTKPMTVLGILGMLLGIGIAIVSGVSHEGSGPAYGVVWAVFVWFLGLVLTCIGVLQAWDEASKKSEQQRQLWLSGWQALRTGMTESQVRELIGAPREVEALVAMTGDMASRWHYGSFLTKGTVTFHGGRVISYCVPRM